MRKFRFNQLSVPLERKGDVLPSLARSLRVREGDIHDLRIIRMSLDARRNDQPHWVYSVEFAMARSMRHPLLSPILAPESTPKASPEASLQAFAKKTAIAPAIAPVKAPEIPETQSRTIAFPREVHIVGAGPCGMWAALDLARKGYQVTLYEQGKPVEERFRDLRRFFKRGEVEPYSNVMFGEGGAGAFSDGKLTSRTRNEFTARALEILVEAGADTEVLYYTKAHIGTDKLQFLVRNVRKRFEELGGIMRFDSRLEDIEISAGRVKRINISGEWITCEALALATGHSARPLYRLLVERGIRLEGKPFAVGFRVEHPQTLVDAAQFGARVDRKLTGAAEYVLRGKGENGAYSFCMCPGGVLIPCSDREGEVCTNGMSYSRRNAPFANSGIVVPVDFSGDPDALRGVRFQEELESKAWRIGGGGFNAPAQTVEAYLEGREDAVLPVSSYPRGLVPHDHSAFFDPAITAALCKSMVEFERTLPGFIRHGLLVSPETRTSSPVRIPRDHHTMESLDIQGLFPLGEGAGYSGGIVSSAADGLRFAALAPELSKR